MGSTSDKARGYTNEAVGKVKQGVGRLIGSDELEAKGAAQEVKGKAQVTWGKTKDAAKNGAKAVDKALGN
jgi:uncharacterized protein YjbJ (UPF0337 family)